MDSTPQFFRFTFVLVFIGLAMPSALRSEEPSEAWAQLSDPAYETRESGQQKLLDWAGQNTDEARVFLCRHFFETPDPEIERRLHAILKETFGSQQRAYLGIKIDVIDLPPELNPNERGIHVLSVNQNSSAGRAGIAMRDIIIAIDDYEIKKSDKTSDVIAQIQKLRAGGKAILTIVRDKKTIKVSVPLLPRPGVEELTPVQEEKIFEEWLMAQKNEIPVLVGPLRP